MPRYRAFTADTTLPATDPNAPWPTLTLHRKLVYADWRPIVELDGLDSDAVIRKYTWGLDLSRTLSGAAGIGGLLAIEDPNDPGDPTDPNVTGVVCYDAMGNVSQLVDLNGVYDPNAPDSVLAARYEYTPYGQVRSSAGDYADENPMRFSSKYWDDETGLGYWGKRFYDPVLAAGIGNSITGESTLVPPGSQDLPDDPVIWEQAITGPARKSLWSSVTSQLFDARGGSSTLAAYGKKRPGTPGDGQDPSQAWDQTAGRTMRCLKKVPKCPSPVKKLIGVYADASKAVSNVWETASLCKGAEHANCVLENAKDEHDGSYNQGTPGGFNFTVQGRVCAVRCKCASGLPVGSTVHCQGDDTAFHSCDNWPDRCGDYCKGRGL